MSKFVLGQRVRWTRDEPDGYSEECPHCGSYTDTYREVRTEHEVVQIIEHHRISGTSTFSYRLSGVEHELAPQACLEAL